MNYQISAIGVGIIAAYSCFVLMIVAWPLNKLFKAFRWKWVVIVPPVLALLVAPWAEEYWIARSFHEACQDAGVHVYKKVAVEGFYDETMRGGYGLIDQYGYRFMEQRTDDGKKIEHIEKPNGQWQVTILDHPTARYHYKYAYQPTPSQHEESIGWKLEKAELQAIDSRTGEIVGRETWFNRRPSWVEGLWINLLGSDLIQCPDPGVRSYKEHLPKATLKPISNK